MPDRRQPPGTWLVIGVIAAALVMMAALRAGRVAAPPARSADAMPWPDMRLDLNEAAPAQLNALPGVGPRLAERIVAERQARGPFASVDDVARVPGIGPATVEGIRPYVVAGNSAAAPPPGPDQPRSPQQSEGTGSGHVVEGLD